MHDPHPIPTSTDQPGPAAARLPLPAAADLQDSLTVAGNDLDRLQRLLSDATETLLGHFHGATAQIQQLSRSAAQHPALPAGQLHETMQHLAGAVRALQFQDMASQLVHHTQRRLRHCAHRLANDAMGADAAGAAAAPPLHPNPVAQDEMHAGTVDLF